VAFVTDTSLSDIGTGVASVHLLGRRARAYYAALGTTGDYRDYHRQDVSARDYRSQNSGPRGAVKFGRSDRSRVADHCDRLALTAIAASRTFIV